MKLKNNFRKFKSIPKRPSKYRFKYPGKCNGRYKPNRTSWLAKRKELVTENGKNPTTNPTGNPTNNPTQNPTLNPTMNPTHFPSNKFSKINELLNYFIVYYLYYFSHH